MDDHLLRFSFQWPDQHFFEVFHFMLLGSVQDATASGEQAGPSHDWTSLNSAAVVPYRYGK